MKFIDLERQFHNISFEVNSAIEKVLHAGDFINGAAVGELEDKLSDYVGVKHCIAVANGTDALEISQKAIGIAKDDEILIPSFTWVSTAETIAYLGAKPIFCDVYKDTFTIDIDDCQKKITKKTKAIVAVSIFGQCANLFELKAFCCKNNLVLIEDAAQSFGATLSNPKDNSIHKSCAVADISTTSFFPSKPLGCYGDGGAIFTNDDSLASCMRLLARHGQKSKEEFVVVGRNSRLDTIQAAILLEKFKIFPEELIMRKKCADLYEKYLLEKNLVKPPFIKSGNFSAYAQFTIIVDSKKRNGLKEHLTKVSIPCATYYADPLYKQEIYRNGSQLKLPVTDKLADSTISIPIHPYLKQEEIKLISFEINNYLSK
jgi:UDP-2-acetamido-2-deoxy-ribo-hexuluronate aminotransferase